MHPYLMHGLRLSPVLLRRILEKIPDAGWDAADPERFTMREAIAHLADWEPILRDERIRAALENPGSTFPAYDESGRAEEMNYARADPWESLAQFEAERAKTVALVESAPLSAFDQKVLHPERGWMSLADLANMLLGHDLYHLEHFSQAI